MKKHFLLNLAAVVIFTLPALAQIKKHQSLKSIDEKVAILLSKMTLEEKVGQMTNMKLMSKSWKKKF